MKMVLSLFTFMALVTISYAQIDDAAYIKKNAIRIDSRIEVNDSAYLALNSYRAILIGEAHGTAEPAEFAEGIVKTFLKRGREVILGMEIPADQMTGFINGRSKDSLAASRFFNLGKIWGVKGDGRANEAWANLLISLGKTNVHFAFFDITDAQCVNTDCNRDSLMFENVNTSMKQYPNAIFVGLCGNAHSMLHPHRGNVPMGWYLQNAAGTCIKDTSQLAGLDFIFRTGTANCNIGDGLKVNEFKDGVLGNPDTAVDYDNYLLLGFGRNNYSGFLYSKVVHASLIWLK